jgi:hypothetical protein
MYRDLALADVTAQYEEAMRSFGIISQLAFSYLIRSVSVRTGVKDVETRTIHYSRPVGTPTGHGTARSASVVLGAMIVIDSAHCSMRGFDGAVLLQNS